jgi:hypothetical protein
MAGDDLLGTLGSIVGIGVGSIELELVKNHFVAGETIHGRLKLALARSTEAKRLVVGLRGTRDRTTVVRDSRGHRSQRRETETVYEFEQQLDGKRSYQTDGYDVHLAIPIDAVAGRLQTPEGTLGDVLRVVSSLVDVGPRPVVWHVYAFLDIPWKANVKRQIQITVSPAKSA